MVLSMKLKLKVKSHPEWTKLVTLGNNIITTFDFSLMLFFTKDEDCDQNGCSLTHFWSMLPFYNLCNTRLCWNFQCSFYRSWVVLSQLTMISKFFQITNWKTVKFSRSYPSDLLLKTPRDGCFLFFLLNLN